MCPRAPRPNSTQNRGSSARRRRIRRKPRSRTRARAGLRVQFDDVAVDEDVLRTDLLAVESRVSPDACVAHGMLEVAMDETGDVAHRFAAPDRERFRLLGRVSGCLG